MTLWQKQGFQQGKLTPYLFTKLEGKELQYLLVSDEGVFLCFQCNHTVKEFVNEQKPEVRVKQLSQLNHCFGVQIKITENGNALLSTNTSKSHQHALNTVKRLIKYLYSTANLEPK